LSAYVPVVARPLRIQAPGIYHVWCRGNRRQAIFTDDHDRERYLRLLADVARRLGWRCLAYCLMTNHVHLVVDVPDQTLSRGMQLLSGRYAQAYNVRHGWVGHLFQGRFSSEPVETDAYSLELGRYVVLNPQRAGIVRHAAGWRWSSYRAMLGRAPAPAFLDTGWTLRQFGRVLSKARAAYAAFVEAGVGPGQLPRTDISRGQTPGRVPPGRVPDD
jgi:REP element-mobilizing transposase RayT